MRPAPTVERLFKRLPKRICDGTYEELALFLDEPVHPSLRVKRIRGTAGIWEMSITNRLTFELDGETVVLRRIGTHDLLRRPRSALRAGAG